MAWFTNINIKSKHEIEIMRQAGQINAEALQAAWEAIQPGATTADVNAAAEEVLKKYGVISPLKIIRDRIRIPPAPVSASMKNWCTAFLESVNCLKGISFQWTAETCLKVLWQTRRSPRASDM